MPYYGMDPAQWQIQQGRRMDQSIRDMLSMFMQTQQFKQGQQQQDIANQFAREGLGYEGRRVSATEEGLGLERERMDFMKPYYEYRSKPPPVPTPEEIREIQLLKQQDPTLTDEQARNIVYRRTPKPTIAEDVARTTALARAGIPTPEDLARDRKEWKRRKRIDYRLQNKFAKPPGGRTETSVMTARRQVRNQVNSAWKSYLGDSNNKKNFTNEELLAHHQAESGLYLDLPKKYNFISKMLDEDPKLVSDDEKQYVAAVQLNVEDVANALNSKGKPVETWAEIPKELQAQIKEEGKDVVRAVMTWLKRRRQGKYYLE